ncbi:MAG: hypothetical protein FWD06_07455 [Oscillospiraceae bacterium]|nr:hypothetical protein [Oscillospiraceae bacterium]
MPSFSMHLAVARAVNAARTPLYFVGALAPDAMDYPHKEQLHFRTCEYRADELAKLAHATDPADDFAEGILVHLFTDWLWDTTHMMHYREHDPSDDWWRRYQAHTGEASSHIYYTEPWAQPLWQAMLAVPQENYGTIAGITPQDITNLMQGEMRRVQRVRGPSAFFFPQLVEAFIAQAAQDYIAWRNAHEFSASKH